MSAHAQTGSPFLEDLAEGGGEPDLLAALADGLAAEAPPPPSAPTTTADPAEAQATSRASRQNDTAATRRLPAPSTAGAGRARPECACSIGVRASRCCLGCHSLQTQISSLCAFPTSRYSIDLTQSCVFVLAGPATFGRRDEGIPTGSASARVRGRRPDSATEPLSGLRVKNPKFPAIVLAERLANLCFVKVGQLRWLFAARLAVACVRRTLPWAATMCSKTHAGVACVAP